jgi:CheY-like chemotaxis protein
VRSLLSSMTNMSSHDSILLVDDEPDITTVLGIGLEDDGFKVDTFNDPLLALSQFKNSSYDLVILDIKMPKMDGFELYREIRKLDDQVKVFFITAFDLLYEEVKNELSLLLPPSQSFTTISDNDSYSKYFIKKPIEIDNFVKKIKEELRNHHGQTE